MSNSLNLEKAIECAAGRKLRLVVVVSHVIHYFCPQYASWHQLPGVDLKVIFGSPQGLEEYFDDQFGKSIRWSGVDMSFPHDFLCQDAKTSTGADIPELDARLNEFRPDVVLVYGYDQPLIRRAIAWCKRTGAELFMLSDAERRSHNSLLKRIAKAFVIPRLLKPFTMFLTVGDANEEYYRHYGVSDDRFVRCFFPIDYAPFDRKANRAHEIRASLRNDLGIPQHHKVILNVGKLVPWKRTQDLVTFSNNLQGCRDDITVLLAGTGRDEMELRKLSKRQGAGGVIFAGFVPPADLIDYYFASDIYAAVSSRDRHSLAISEAIYAGLPVIISDRCGSYGPSDDVRPGLNGLVYRCGDCSRLSEALLHLANNQELLTSFSQESRKIAVHHQALAHGAALAQAFVVVRTRQRPTTTQS